VASAWMTRVPASTDADRAAWICSWLSASEQSHSEGSGSVAFVDMPRTLRTTWDGNAPGVVYAKTSTGMGKRFPRVPRKAPHLSRPVSLIRPRQRETKTQQFALRPASKATKHRPCNSEGP